MRDLHQIMKDIQPYMKFIFEHEDEFLNSFAENKSKDDRGIVELSFDSNEIKFAYCYLESGEQLIGDAITTDDFVSWMRKVRGEYP